MRARTLVLGAVVALIAISIDAQPVRKRALLIGIDDYTASLLKPASTSAAPQRDIPNLDGAGNDVELMRDLLESVYRFKATDIVTLTNQQATRSAIVGALDRLISATAKNDVIFFYYSGHGSQVRNSRSSEHDKLDESLVPADARHGANDIRDKALRKAFNQILDRGARLTVILDSCHSGSGARGGLDGGPRARVVPPDLRDVADASSEPDPEERGALVLSAARDFDQAFETMDERGRMRGAFSWAFTTALAAAPKDEPVSHTFLRAQARLHAIRPGQTPVIAGPADVRFRPFLCNRSDRRDGGPVIAVEKSTRNGGYIVQGGWTSGVTVGSELRVAGRDDVRLEVKSLVGVTRAEAHMTHATARGSAKSAPLDAGTLLEIVAWAPPPARPLRVWIPSAGEEAAALARRFRDAAAERGIRWLTDPVETPPTHLIRWRDGGWELVAGHRATRTAAPLAGIEAGASLFVQLPVPPKLVRAVSDVEGIEFTGGPEAADYILAGRLTAKGAEYAFVRPQVSAGDAPPATLPLRTGWSGGTSTIVLREALRCLQRVHAWHELRSPDHAEAHYTLGVRRADDRVLVDDGVLLGDRRHYLVLRAKPAPAGGVYTRYVYAFVIDSAGTSVLLFPRADSGAVENRLPITTEAAKPIPNPPEEIPLDESDPFTVAPPYGTDTYFLLTTDEPLTALTSLEWAGVRGKRDARTAASAPKSPLERLLARTLSGTRGDSSTEAIRTPPGWSLEKVTFQSVPPRRVKP